MENIVLIPESDMGLCVKSKQRYMGGNEYIQLEDRTIDKLMAKWCYIDSRRCLIEGNVYNSEKECSIALTDNQLVLIASGRCMVIRSGHSGTVIKFSAGLAKGKNILDIFNTREEYEKSEEEVDMEGIIRLACMHTLIGRKIRNNYKIIRNSFFELNRRNMGLYLTKGSVWLNGASSEKIYDGLEVSEPVFDNSISDTIDRWNYQLSEGRIILRSDELKEVYMRVDINSIMLELNKELRTAVTIQ